MKKASRSSTVETVENAENEETENEDDETPSNLIPFEQWEGAKGVERVEQRKGSGTEREEEGEAALVWKCFENTVMSIAGSAQQLKDLNVLLQMKGIGQQEIDRKIRGNPKMIEALQSVHGAIEWIRDIIIDSDYSHSLM